MTHTTPAIDLASVIDNLGGQPLAYRDVAGAFLEQTRAAMSELGWPDRDRLVRLVHMLGGSLGAVGAYDAQHVAQQAEAALRRSQDGDCTRELVALRSAMQAAMQAVTEALRHPMFNDWPAA